MSDSLKRKAVKGVVWSGVERFSVQGIQFIVLLIMARLLSPHEYGIIGMLTVFMALAQVIIDSGFSQALIRKQDRTELDNCSIFYFNIVVSLLLYGLFFIIAPFVAGFYKIPELTVIMRVLCLGIVINSFGIVQRAIYTIGLDFKTQAKASASAAVVSGIVGIYLAYSGYGVWALVAQQIVSLGFNVLVLWAYSSWKPKFLFSFNSIKEFFGFGSKLLVAGSLEAVFQNLYQIVIGRFFSASIIGFYTRALQFVSLPSANIGGIIQRVTYPVLCEIQDDDQRLNENIKRILNVLSFVVFPLMVFLFYYADEIIAILLGTKWMYCSVLMRLLSLSMLLYPIHALNLNILIVKGRSDLYLRVEVLKKVLTVLILVVTIPFGIEVMCYGQILNSMLALVINTYYTGKLVRIGLMKQLELLIPVAFLCAFIGFLSYYLVNMFISNSNILCVSIGALFYAFLYMGTAFSCRMEAIKDVKLVLKK